LSQRRAQQLDGNSPEQSGFQRLSKIIERYLRSEYCYASEPACHSWQSGSSVIIIIITSVYLSSWHTQLKLQWITLHM